MIVSDAGPIIIFARIGQLSLLLDAVGALTIPEAVYAEIALNKGGMPGAAEVAQASWIRRVSVADRSILDALPHALHAGEREAIGLAQELRAQLLVDELRARRIARGLGIEVIGTLRALTEAKNRGLVDFIRPFIVQMQNRGYRFHPTLIQRILDQAGEG